MNAFRSFQVIKEPVFHTAISDLTFTELAENEVLVKLPILMSITKMHWQ